ncbi:hypothetical protein B9T16_25555 [Arthrospira sp. PCC 8006]
MFSGRLGVENGVAFVPSHSEPYVRVFPHTARGVRHIPIIGIDRKRLYKLTDLAGDRFSFSV